MRCHLAIAMEIPFIIAPLPVKACGRLTQGNNQDLPNIGKDFAALRVDLFCVCTAGNGLAQTKRTHTKNRTQSCVHGTRVGRSLALGHNLLGNQTVLHVDRRSHIPLTTITQDVGKQELHEATVDGLVSSCDDVGEEPVGALKLVPEEDVALGELEVLYAQAHARSRAQQIQRGEKPATA